MLSLIGHKGNALRHVCCARQMSSSSRIRQLLKKFMFQVHPDFFHNDKHLQQVNATNLSVLQSIIDQTSTHSDAGVNSLTFYLKPDLVGSKAQKVRVSTTRIERSITEILETVGVEVSDDLEESEPALSSTQSTVMASAEQTLDFLSSMFERKPLMALREIRATELKRLEKVCFGMEP
jgi:hypothetical protein